ncbi:MAG: glycosyltransferase family 4 protein [Anaerolineales bacterium]|nr:glycosyltransferase family 4 protein [Anaerolineales bacterium]MCB9127860.1 glycosyltransferase family 4 protein [Ardenticatenales bacterium]
MRILHLVHQYLPDHVGGVELNTHHLAQAQQRAGDDVAVVFPQVGGDAPHPTVGAAGERRLPLPIPPRTDLTRFSATFHQPALQRAFAQRLAEFQPDLVHIQHLMGLPTTLIESLHEAGIPYLITLHDYWWICANAQLLTNDTGALCHGPERWINCGRCAMARAGLRGAARRAAPAVAPLFAWRGQRLGNVLRGAAARMAPTAFTRDWHIAMGLAPPIEVVPYGIPLPNPLPSRRPRNDERLRLAYVGSIAPQKGVHLLVDAVGQLPQDQVQLDLYGGLDSFPDYVAELRARRGDAILWHGRIPNEMVLARLAAADLLVVPSIWYETSVIAIQEAFAVGTPVVASDLGAMAERVQHGEDGLLFNANRVADLAATLRRFLDEPQLLPRLRSGIRPVHTIDAQAAQLDRVYGDVIRARRGAW